METNRALAEMIQASQKLVFLTGAGISTESGIPDFRSSGGIYANGNVEHYISRYFYNKSPKDFWKHFKEIFQLKMLGNYEPNNGHLFIKALEDMGKEVTVLTQNIDGLHQKAGSKHVLELHGTLRSAHCPKCKRVYNLEYTLKNDIPRCELDDFILDTDVVLFGDAIKHFDEAINAVESCDLLIVMGSSLNVTPVNAFPEYAKRSWNTKLAIINKEETIKDRYFDVVIHEKIGKAVRNLRDFI
ncbi:MAG: NAD-dependent protein deacylase [Bacillota bacterium]|nr:NAD-dependent protein deacylase [Bacillota bacterium]MDP4154576.1 NAD-dependent protein deacylase [Bacillota bacterium]